jgi:hypothetical protein
MKYILPILIFFSFLNITKAQEMYIKVGKNIANYHFIDSTNETVNLQSDFGNQYEVGYSTFALSPSKIYFTVGACYNEYNAIGYTGNINLSWQANYLGLKATSKYLIIDDLLNRLSLKLGILSETIVHGNEKIDNDNYNLLKQAEFKGFVISPNIGLQYCYKINNDVNLLFDYEYSSHYNLSNKTTQKLSIQNHGISFGLTLSIY